MPKAKPKHAASALSKAVKTQRHATPAASESGRVVLDIRKAAAATVEFSGEDLGLHAGKRAPTKSTAKTVLSGESSINVDRRIRNASVPIGAQVDDVANVSEELTLEGFDRSSAAKHLMPRRPAWSFELSSGRLHHREVEGFKKWLDDVRELIAERGGYPPAFEQNLQVWRQLWRVLERCDVAVMVLDSRHPMLHLPPALVYHVSRTLRKPLVLVLNKLDTVDPCDAAHWAACLQEAIPGISGIVGYSKEHLEPEHFGDLQVGKEALIEACHKAHKAFDAARAGGAPGERAAAAEDEAPGDPEVAAEAGRIMLGMVGHPNVGKSSLVNSLMGGKVVSVKATPGHTKTLQTLVLDDATCLCDSPGIVFPRLNVPREAQIVGMLIPLAQVREPFSAIRWVMEHAVTPLNELLSLRPATLQQVLDLQEAGVDVLQMDGTVDDTGPMPWSPMLICAQYAVQRGFMKGGRPDCLLSGTEILQRVLEGRVPYRVRPPAAFSPSVPHATPEEGAQEEDSDSDWQIDDGDYESGPDADAADPNAGLFEVFGMERKGPGSGSIASRKKQEKRKKREALAGVEDKGPLQAENL